MPARPFSHRSLYSFAASFWRGWLGSRSVAAVLQPGNFGDQSASPRSRCAGSLRTGYGRDEANLRNYNYSKVFGMAVQVTPTMANVDMQELSMAAESAVGQGKLLDSIDPEPSLRLRQLWAFSACCTCPGSCLVTCTVVPMMRMPPFCTPLAATEGIALPPSRVGEIWGGFRGSEGRISTFCRKPKLQCCFGSSLR